MMKWKVIKNPRASSADRSLECLKNDAQPKQNSDSNNNKQDSSVVKENNKQQESGFTRKPSLHASDCINLKSFLRLTRQRSEINLSSLSVINPEPRRSRSEVRGISCDRLSIGYHTTQPKITENGKTRSSSPQGKSGCFLRGRKRERETRNSSKSSLEVFGKTIVTGTNQRSNSKSRSCEYRTIVDGSDCSRPKICLPKSSRENRKSKLTKEIGDVIVEDAVYAEIEQKQIPSKLLEEKSNALKDPIKVIKKKGLAPKPQITASPFNELNNEVNLHPNGTKINENANCFDEKSKTPPCFKPARKVKTCSGNNQDKKAEPNNNRNVKLNNLVNSETNLLNSKNKIICSSSNSLIAIAEIHKNSVNSYLDDAQKNTNHHVDGKDVMKSEKSNKNSKNNTSQTIEDEAEIDTYSEEREIIEEERILNPSLYYIDSPDYSTLDSENGNNPDDNLQECSSSRDSSENVNVSVAKISSDNDRSSNEISSSDTSERGKSPSEGSVTSILRDFTNDEKCPNGENTPKKVVRFEKLDLIEKYKRSKAESAREEDETDSSTSEDKPATKRALDINSNEISATESSNAAEDTLRASETETVPISGCLNIITCSPTTKTSCPQTGMTVNVLVRKPSLDDHTNGLNTDPQTADSQTQFVVKKSFVLTIAKQEKGFKSLCATKKPEVLCENPKNDPRISVTFLCSEPPTESWTDGTTVSTVRLRSLSVPPQSLQPADIIAPQPPVRGRSRERRSKERQNCRKNHKSRKKDAVFHMPQAVIDELSQVLEKRKPSLDEIRV